jgi:Domain of unknown function (DUF4345)
MKRGLQVVLVIGGLVAITTGLVAIIGGIDTFPGSPSAENPADNEGRFLNGIWVGFGVLILWVVPRVERETTLVRILAAAIFLGGLARLASIIDVGEPADMQYVLMGIELVLGPLVIVWQALVARQDAAAEG